MSGPFEKYVAQAAEALNAAVCICRTGHNQYGGWYVADPTCPRCGDNAAKSRVILATVGPLIQEDTRERMVAAAGAALEREKAQAEPKVKWADLFGMDPDFTGKACSVDYIRWQRGAETPVEFKHEDCWSFLLNDGKPLS